MNPIPATSVCSVRQPGRPPANRAEHHRVAAVQDKVSISSQARRLARESGSTPSAAPNTSPATATDTGKPPLTRAERLELATAMLQAPPQLRGTLVDKTG